jgi:aspartate/methionine/tyrosine aminotransferase
MAIMTFVANRIHGTEAPPIAEAQSWLKGRRGEALLNLCQAVPSYPPAKQLQDEIARLAREPSTGGYTEVLGLPELRQAHAAKLSLDYGAPIDVAHVAMTTGCNQAYAAVIMVGAEAGDNVIMPTPWYFNHHMWLKMLGVEARGIPAFAAEGFPSVEDAAPLIDARTRAIILCTPNNPSGAVYPASVIEAFYKLAQRHGILLIVDETYKDFRPTLVPSHGIFAMDGWQDTLVHLYSFSKIYALAGYRLGSIVAGPVMITEAEKILDTMTICPPQIVQRAAMFALRELDQWKAEKRDTMRERLEAIRAAFKTPGLGYELISSGAYFAYVKHPFRGEASKSVAQRLAQKHDLLCLPGSMFGPGQEDYLRFAFANLDAGLMGDVVKRLRESEG